MTLNKRNAFVFLVLVVLIGGLFVATAYGTNNPPVFGHTPGEVDPGTFGGDVNSLYVFPGKLKTGPAYTFPQGTYPNGDPNLVVHSSSQYSGIAVSSLQLGGDTYIDFLNAGAIKGNIAFKNNKLNINSHSSAQDTPVIIGGGINNNMERLEVIGKVKANDFCIGTNCFSSWSGGGGGGVTYAVITQVSGISIQTGPNCAESANTRTNNVAHAIFAKADITPAGNSVALRYWNGANWMVFTQTPATSGVIYTLSAIIPPQGRYCYTGTSGGTIANAFEVELA